MGNAIKMTKCILCNKTINSNNDSAEHIIPNAIGGVEKIKGFLCRKCNSETGHKWDAVLAKQLNSLSVLCGIKRDDGVSPPETFETIKGLKIKKFPDGSIEYPDPKYKYEESNGQKKITIRNLRSPEEARKRLGDLEKKYSGKIISKQIEDKYFFLEDASKLNLTIGGIVEVNRSILKTALAFASHSKVNPHECEAAKKYLTETTAVPFGYYYEKDLVNNRPKNSIIHCLAISGNPKTKLLLAYIEYFSLHRIIVCLDDNYIGKYISNTYGIDPTTGKELKLNIDIQIAKHGLKEIYEGKKMSENSYKDCLAVVIPFIKKKQLMNSCNIAFERAFNEAIEECGLKGKEIITINEELQLSRVIAEKMIPWFEYQRKISLKPEM